MAAAPVTAERSPPSLPADGVVVDSAEWELLSSILFEQNLQLQRQFIVHVLNYIGNKPPTTNDSESKRNDERLDFSRRMLYKAVKNAAQRLRNNTESAAAAASAERWFSDSFIDMLKGIALADGLDCTVPRNRRYILCAALTRFVITYAAFHANLLIQNGILSVYNLYSDRQRYTNATESALNSPSWESVSAREGIPVGRLKDVFVKVEAALPYACFKGTSVLFEFVREFDPMNEWQPEGDRVLPPASANNNDILPRDVQSVSGGGGDRSPPLAGESVADGTQQTVKTALPAKRDIGSIGETNSTSGGAGVSTSNKKHKGGAVPSANVQTGGATLSTAAAVDISKSSEKNAPTAVVSPPRVETVQDDDADCWDVPSPAAQEVRTSPSSSSAAAESVKDVTAHISSTNSVTAAESATSNDQPEKTARAPSIASSTASSASVRGIPSSRPKSKFDFNKMKADMINDKAGSSASRRVRPSSKTPPVVVADKAVKPTATSAAVGGGVSQSPLTASPVTAINNTSKSVSSASTAASSCSVDQQRATKARTAFFGAEAATSDRTTAPPSTPLRNAAVEQVHQQQHATVKESPPLHVKSKHVASTTNNAAVVQPSAATLALVHSSAPSSATAAAAPTSAAPSAATDASRLSSSALYQPKPEPADITIAGANLLQHPPLSTGSCGSGAQTTQQKAAVIVKKELVKNAAAEENNGNNAGPSSSQQQAAPRPAAPVPPPPLPTIQPKAEPVDVVTSGTTYRQSTAAAPSGSGAALGISSGSTANTTHRQSAPFAVDGLLQQQPSDSNKSLSAAQQQVAAHVGTTTNAALSILPAVNGSTLATSSNPGTLPSSVGASTAPNAATTGRNRATTTTKAQANTTSNAVAVMEDRKLLAELTRNDGIEEARKHTDPVYTFLITSLYQDLYSKPGQTILPARNFLYAQELADLHTMFFDVFCRNDTKGMEIAKWHAKLLNAPAAAAAVEAPSSSQQHSSSRSRSPSTLSSSSSSAALPTATISALSRQKLIDYCVHFLNWLHLKVSGGAHSPMQVDDDDDDDVIDDDIERDGESEEQVDDDSGMLGSASQEARRARRTTNASAPVLPCNYDETALPTPLLARERLLDLIFRHTLCRLKRVIMPIKFVSFSCRLCGDDDVKDANIHFGKCSTLTKMYRSAQMPPEGGSTNAAARSEETGKAIGVLNTVDMLIKCPLCSAAGTPSTDNFSLSRIGEHFRLHHEVFELDTLHESIEAHDRKTTAAAVKMKRRGSSNVAAAATDAADNDDVATMHFKYIGETLPSAVMCDECDAVFPHIRHYVQHIVPPRQMLDAFEVPLPSATLANGDAYRAATWKDLFTRIDALGEGHCCRRFVCSRRVPLLVVPGKTGIIGLPLQDSYNVYNKFKLATDENGNRIAKSSQQQRVTPEQQQQQQHANKLGLTRQAEAHFAGTQQQQNHNNAGGSGRQPVYYGNSPAGTPRLAGAPNVAVPFVAGEAPPQQHFNFGEGGQQQQNYGAFTSPQQQQQQQQRGMPPAYAGHNSTLSVSTASPVVMDSAYQSAAAVAGSRFSPSNVQHTTAYPPGAVVVMPLQTTQQQHLVGVPYIQQQVQQQQLHQQQYNAQQQHRVQQQHALPTQRPSNSSSNQAVDLRNKATVGQSPSLQQQLQQHFAYTYNQYHPQGNEQGSESLNYHAALPPNIDFLQQQQQQQRAATTLHNNNNNHTASNQQQSSRAAAAVSQPQLNNLLATSNSSMSIGREEVVSSGRIAPPRQQQQQQQQQPLTTSVSNSAAQARTTKPPGN